MAEAEALPKFLKKEGDEGVSKECKSLLQTIPFQNGWLPLSNLHIYQGFWYRPQILNGVLSVQKNFRSNHSDILIATSPKSGATWLKALVFSLLNHGHHPVGLNPLLQNNPHDLVPFLELNLFMEDRNPDLSSFDVGEMRLFSTHMPFSSLPSSVKCRLQENCVKIVYLCRNPKDTVISLWHFVNKVSPISLEEAIDKFCRGVSAYGPFWDHVLEYWKASEENPNNVVFLKYEEIKEQPHKNLRMLADFLGCPFSREEESNGKVDEILKICSFENLRELQVNMTGKTLIGTPNKMYFRQGKVGDSANYLTQEMIHRLECITEEKLHGSTLRLL